MNFAMSCEDDPRFCLLFLALALFLTTSASEDVHISSLSFSCHSHLMRTFSFTILSVGGIIIVGVYFGVFLLLLARKGN